MIRLYVLVEGQTEQAFVQRVLAPHLEKRGLWVHTITVTTSREKAGSKRRGGGRWKHWFADLRRLTGEQPGPDVRFTTLFDLYGLPPDFPELEQHRAENDTTRRADRLEEAMARAIGDHRLIPYIQRHEFEALVLASLENLRTRFEDPKDLEGIDQLQAFVRSSAPEDIDDGEASAPSKRLKRCIPFYEKPVHGPAAIEQTGLREVRAQCPRFDAWVRKLEALGENLP